jgi:two-component system nitrogen regulation sensor histidine kinase NtrY
VSRLTFRARLFLALLTVATLSVAVMAAVGVVTLRTIPEVRLGGDQQEIERLRTTAQELLTALSGVPLAPAGEQALADHREAMTNFLTRVDNIRGLTRNLTRVDGLPSRLGAVALGLLALVAIIVALLSRQFSSPLDEVVAWTGRIQRREPLPSEAELRRGIPEFAELRDALRTMAASIDQGRNAELEAERLRTFGEVARRVAHEMKNPLTPIRLAVLQMRRSGAPGLEEPLEVIATESQRLEAMAREFSQLGRLPETAATPVDLRELLEEKLRAAVPESMRYDFHCSEATVVVDAQYDALRRAFSNLFRNAVEACDGHGRVSVSLQRDLGTINIAIADSGPGIPEAKRDKIFQPYFTDKRDGTGLGLAIVRQTIEQHKGTITVADTPGGGATFLVRLPA